MQVSLTRGQLLAVWRSSSVPTRITPSMRFRRSRQVSTEAEVVAANHSVRAQGLPTLSLMSVLWELLDAPKEKQPAGGSAKPIPFPGRDNSGQGGNPVLVYVDPELDEIRYGGFEQHERTIAPLRGLNVHLMRSLKLHFVKTIKQQFTSFRLEIPHSFVMLTELKELLWRGFENNLRKVSSISSTSTLCIRLRTS